MRKPGDTTPQCDDCNRNVYNDVRLGPMLRDETWLKLADKHAVLCAECMFERHSPRSWYDLFRSRESELLTNLSEWASFLNRLKRASGVKRGRILARYAHHAEIDGVWSPTADEHPQ
jgi:hypothetical protein